MSLILPRLTPRIMVSLIWPFTAIWNDFFFGVAFTGSDGKIIAVGLNNISNTTSLVYIFAGKCFVKGVTAGAVKG